MYFASAQQMTGIPDNSIDLVVTSPPYPMIEMWDAGFGFQDPRIVQRIGDADGWGAFDAMHQALDAVWDEMCRVLKNGGFACINIGDAARTIGGAFTLYPNHARILTYLTRKGLTSLPVILWRKQTNAPNKFMGSGMLPAGAYVTLEHEYILIFRKGPKRAFTSDAEKLNRHRSAIFWEERNQWFSDVWMDLKGTPQKIREPGGQRKRSGAFPFELPYRLIHMLSVKGDMVLDPFCGTGTTLLAAMAAGRNSAGFEIDPGFREAIHARAAGILTAANARIAQRLEDHCRFVAERREKNGDFRHRNRSYGFPVVTGQERELLLNDLLDVREAGKDGFAVEYSALPQAAFCMNDADVPAALPKKSRKRNPDKKAPPVAKIPRQQLLL